MRILGGLILAALMSGIASGLILFGGIGVFFTLPVALICAVVFGLPAYFILHRFGWLSWWQLALAGTVCASPCLLLLSGHVYFEFAVVVTGALAGILFWWAAIGLTSKVRSCERSEPRSNLTG